MLEITVVTADGNETVFEAVRVLSVAVAWNEELGAYVLVAQTGEHEYQRVALYEPNEENDEWVTACMLTRERANAAKRIVLGALRNARVTTEITTAVIEADRVG